MCGNKLYNSNLRRRNIAMGTFESCFPQIKAVSFAPGFSTYRDQLLTFAGLTESQYAVHIDAGLCLVAVLNEAKGLKVKLGNRGKAIACHRCPLVR